MRSRRCSIHASARNTIVDPIVIIAAGSRRELVRTGAAQGYAWADQALDLEVNGVAVLVPGADPVASVSLYGPAYRLNPSDRPGLGDALRDLVSEQAPGLLGV